MEPFEVKVQPLGQGSQPRDADRAAEGHADPGVAGWEKEAEARRLWRRAEEVRREWRQADVTARGRRSQADARQAVVEREEAGLRLAEELSEDRLLVARETLELSVKRQAERRHVLERRPLAGGATETNECKELAVLHRNERAFGRCAASTRWPRRRTSVGAGVYTSERGGGDDEMGGGGAAATVGGDDAGDDGRDDGEGASRGGTPAPLSAGSGATLGGGAAGSEMREASEHAGASGTSDEAAGGDDGAGASAEPTVRGRGKRGKTKGGQFRRWGAAQRR